jgi:hypothetical protein
MLGCVAYKMKFSSFDWLKPFWHHRCILANIFDAVVSKSIELEKSFTVLSNGARVAKEHACCMLPRCSA